MSPGGPTVRRSLARAVGVSPRTITRWAAAGKIPGAVRRPSGRWTYPEGEAAVDWLLSLLNAESKDHANHA